MRSRRKTTHAERALGAALFEPLEMSPMGDKPASERARPAGTLWQRTSHAQQTCGGLDAGCPLCEAQSAAPQSEVA